MIVIRLRPNGAPLSVRRVAVPGLGEGVSLLATAASRPETVLAGDLEARSTAIDAIRFSPGGPSVRRLAAVRDGLIDAFDPSGRQVLYLQGHGPPALWRATLSAGRLTDRQRLFRSSPVGATAW